MLDFTITHCFTKPFSHDNDFCGHAFQYTSLLTNSSSERTHYVLSHLFSNKDSHFQNVSINVCNVDFGGIEILGK
jgi:hypothetical protein